MRTNHISPVFRVTAVAGALLTAATGASAASVADLRVKAATVSVTFRK